MSEQYYLTDIQSQPSVLSLLLDKYFLLNLKKWKFLPKGKRDFRLKWDGSVIQAFFSMSHVLLFVIGASPSTRTAFSLIYLEFVCLISFQLARALLCLQGRWRFFLKVSGFLFCFVCVTWGSRFNHGLYVTVLCALSWHSVFSLRLIETK